MTEEKQKRAKRPKDEVLADLKARIARHEWAGPKQALKLVREASKLLEEAQAACGDRFQDAVRWGDVQGVLTAIDVIIEETIPPEAKP